MYSGNGQLVADFSKEKEYLFSSGNSNNVINSFLSAEDKNFFHPELMQKE